MKLRSRPELKTIRCARPACGKKFKQTRAWQRYHNRDCQRLAWEERNPRVQLSA